MELEELTTTSVDQVIDWLTRQTLAGPVTAELFRGCCERLVAAGIPLQRGHLSFSTLHPLYQAVGCTWRADGGLEIATFPHQTGAGSEAWQASPLNHMVERRLPRLRRRLAGPEACLDFPVLREFHDQGATDYVAFLLPFDSERRRGVVGSWTTAAPRGFSDRQLADLARIERHVALACKVAVNDQISRNVVDAYLGPEIGRRVLDGGIKRGDGEAVRAAIWYSDLRNSTDLARTLSVEAFLARLNRYFEIAVGGLRAEGGEVVALVGDAVLGLFRSATEGRAEDQAADQAADQADGRAEEGPDDAEVCRRALAAARRARRDLAESGDDFDFGIALNLGTVVYGNIGAADRLEFTVVGAAVNEAARVESLTRSLGAPVLAGAAFAGALPLAWRDLGRHVLRGHEDGLRVFAPPDE